MTMQNIKFGELMNILKNDDETPFTNFKVEDMDQNQICGEDLLHVDFIEMRDWLVDSLCIDEYGRATIVVNSGTFTGFHFQSKLS